MDNDRAGATGYRWNSGRVRQKVSARLFRLTVRLHNTRVRSNQARETRDRAPLQFRVFEAYKILTISGGEFISLIDLLKDCEQAAEDCLNVGTFPGLQARKGNAMSCYRRQSSFTITRRSRRRALAIFATEQTSTKF